MSVDPGRLILAGEVGLTGGSGSGSPRESGGHGGRWSAGRRPEGCARGGRARRSGASPGTRRAPSGSSAPHGRSRWGLHRRQQDLGTLGDLREPQRDAVVPVGCGGLRPALKGGTIAVHRVQLERRLTQVAQVPPNNLRLQWGEVVGGQVGDGVLPVGVGGEVVVDELASVGGDGRNGRVPSGLEFFAAGRLRLGEGLAQQFQGRGDGGGLAGQVLGGGTGPPGRRRGSRRVWRPVLSSPWSCRASGYSATSSGCREAGQVRAPSG